MKDEGKVEAPTCFLSSHAQVRQHRGNSSLTDQSFAIGSPDRYELPDEKNKH
jgi:hypothetical protein